MRAVVLAFGYFKIMYKITFSKSADKALRRLPQNLAQKIAKKIKELAENPNAMRNRKQLTNHPGCRLRVGDWRVIYTIHDNELIIHVVNIKTRGEAYK
ncbi:MAG: type II toxin-antitoxin system RelE family toxin [Thermodesulfobacteriota bacterium]